MKKEFSSWRVGAVAIFGKVGRVERRPVGDCEGVATKPELAPPRPSKPADVAERKRQAAAARGGAGLSSSFDRNVMAESDRLFCVADARHIQRPLGHEDDRAL